MLIRCPTCACGYDVAPALLRGERVLRCAHCRDAWVHRLDPGPEIAAEAGHADPRFATPTARTAPETSPWGMRLPSIRPPTGAAAAAFAAALLVASGAAVASKARVVALYPPSEAVFATLGLPVNLSGLAFGDLRSTVASGEGPATLTIEGRITNLRPNATPVPALRVAVRDKDSRELYTWTAPAPKSRLAAGETVSFRGRLTAPPPDGHDLAVTFADATPDGPRVTEAMASDR